eukprot:scaffold121618_cov36-Prasinocladus_malaysianus.AAC.2
MSDMPTRQPHWLGTGTSDFDSTSTYRMNNGTSSAQQSPPGRSGTVLRTRTNQIGVPEAASPSSMQQA